MKKTKLLLLTLLFVFMLLLCCKTYNVLAESDQNDAEIQENIVSNNVLDENTIIIDTNTENALQDNKSDIELWLENNLGWVIGVPLGTLISFLLEIFALAKKAKETAKSLTETKDIHETVKKEIVIAKNMLIECEQLYNKVGNYVIDIKDKISDNSELVKTANENFKTLISVDNVLNEKIEKLEKEFGVIVTKNSEFVVNGKAEEINKIIRG